MTSKLLKFYGGFLCVCLMSCFWLICIYLGITTDTIPAFRTVSDGLRAGRSLWAVFDYLWRGLEGIVAGLLLGAFAVWLPYRVLTVEWPKANSN